MPPALCAGATTAADELRTMTGRDIYAAILSAARAAIRASPAAAIRAGRPSPQELTGAAWLWLDDHAQHYPPPLQRVTYYAARYALAAAARDNEHSASRWTPPDAQTPEPAPPPGAPLRPTEAAAILSDTIRAAAMPPRYARILSARLAGYTLASIAAAEGISPQRVHQLDQDARRRFARGLKP